MTTGAETYTNPQLDAELCGYYSKEKSNSRIDPKGKDNERLTKREWSNKDVSRAACKQCNGRGYQVFSNKNVGYGLACKCIESYLINNDDSSSNNDEFVSSNPLASL